MSFFDDTKNAGLLLWIGGILMIIAGILAIIAPFITDGVEDYEMLKKIGYAVIGVGSLIAAIVYFKLGQDIKAGSYSKFQVLSMFIAAVAYASLVSGIVGGIGYCIAGEFTNGIVDIVVGVIIWLILTWANGKINDGNETAMDKIIWIVLLIIFLLGFIGGVFGGIGILGISLITAIASIVEGILYLILLVYVINTRSEFGI